MPRRQCWLPLPSHANPHSSLFVYILCYYPAYYHLLTFSPPPYDTHPSLNSSNCLLGVHWWVIICNGILFRNEGQLLMVPFLDCPTSFIVRREDVLHRQENRPAQYPWYVLFSGLLLRCSLQFSTEHRVYIEKDGLPISPFHDIPLYAK
jgi:hypothetical protein